MDAPAARTGPAHPDRLRPLRYLLRSPLLLAHLALSLPLTLGVIVSPLGRIGSAAGDPWKHRAVRWWSRSLLRIFGIHARALGTPLHGGVLLVSNHRSWLDIELIHAFRMACFVAKSEIERWPLIGWLASQADTIYHRRGSTASLSEVVGTMVERLRAGLAVAVFPEGGIRPGNRVHTFHARLFQAALDAAVPAQPVALRMSRNGEPCDALCERPGEGFLRCFLRVLGEPRSTVEVIFLEPVYADGSGRRRLADACRARILAALGQTDEPRRGARAEAAVDDADPLAEETAASDAAQDSRQ